MEYIFLLTLFVVAFLYASVGHGGASGYLALMALFSIETVFMKSSALTLNLFVSSISFVSFYKGGHFRLKLLLPFVLASMPMAYLGALIHVDARVYKIILGAALLIAVSRMLLPVKQGKGEAKQPKVVYAVLVGALLGLFSGMIGIGGGIILSPLLLLFNWASLKETAAVSAAFIFLNSAAGLLGIASSGVQLSPEIFIWVIVGVIGGFAGAYSGSFKIHALKLKYILAFVLIVASVKLFFV